MTQAERNRVLGYWLWKLYRPGTTYLDEDDLKQAALTRVWQEEQKRGELDGPAFSTVVRSGMIDALRSASYMPQRRRQPGQDRPEPEYAIHVDISDLQFTLRAPDEEQPDVLCLREERRRLMYAKLRRLPPDHLTVVEQYLQDRPLQDLTKVFGLTPSRVSQMLTEATGMLRKACRAAT